MRLAEATKFLLDTLIDINDQASDAAKAHANAAGTRWGSRQLAPMLDSVMFPASVQLKHKLTAGNLLGSHKYEVSSFDMPVGIEDGWSKPYVNRVEQLSKEEQLHLPVRHITLSTVYKSSYDVWSVCINPDEAAYAINWDDLKLVDDPNVYAATPANVRLVRESFGNDVTPVLRLSEIELLTKAVTGAPRRISFDDADDDFMSRYGELPYKI